MLTVERRQFGERSSYNGANCGLALWLFPPDLKALSPPNRRIERRTANVSFQQQQHLPNLVFPTPVLSYNQAPRCRKEQASACHLNSPAPSAQLPSANPSVAGFRQQMPQLRQLKVRCREYGIAL